MSKQNHPFFAPKGYNYAPSRHWAQRQPTAPSTIDDEDVMDALRKYQERRDKGVEGDKQEESLADEEEEASETVLLGPEEKREAEQLDAFRVEEGAGEAEDKGIDVESAEARSAKELCEWAETVIPYLGDLTDLAEEYLKPCQELLQEQGIQQGRYLYTLRNDKLSPAFPWLSGLTRQLYDNVVGRRYPYWFLVIGAAVKVDSSMIGLLDLIKHRSSFQEVRRYLVSISRLMAGCNGPCCYVLSPDTDAAELKVYVGMALNGRTRLMQHISSNVNSLMAGESEIMDKRDWVARVWFQENQIGDTYFPTPARHFLEHVAIVAAGSTLHGHYPLQHNVMDRIRSITLVSAADVVKIIRVLDAVLSEGFRLPNGIDTDAWKIALASVLPPGSEVSMNTLGKAMRGTHRPHILHGMDPPPTFWLAHINSPEEDFSQFRNTGFTDAPLPATGRPVSSAAIALFDEQRCGSRISRHSQYTHINLLDNLARAIEIQGSLMGINK